MISFIQCGLCEGGAFMRRVDPGGRAWAVIVGQRRHIVVGDPRVLIAVAPQVRQEAEGRGRVLVAPPGQGQHVLRRRLERHHDHPVGAYGTGGGLGLTAMAVPSRMGRQSASRAIVEATADFITLASNPPNSLHMSLRPS